MTQKNNIFEHIFYEISQYLYTFDILRNTKKRVKCQVLFNCIWDSHFIHLRNLKDFFLNTKNENEKKTGNDDIVLGTILVPSLIDKCALSKKDLEYNDDNSHTLNKEQVTYPMIINKSVEHLTLKRTNPWGLSISMSDLQNKTIDNMFRVLFPLVVNFLHLLENLDNVNPLYREDLSGYKDKLHHMTNKLLPYISTTYNLITQ